MLATIAVFGSSRSAVLSIIAFYVIGGWLLRDMNIDGGTQTEDAA
jgi:hypothetical protein